MRPSSSAFVQRVEYVPLTDEWRAEFGTGQGFLLVTIRGTTYAYLAPSWTPGLIAAADATGRSVGRLYNRLIKGRPQVTLGEVGRS